jgi:glycosyltransferase involved in cell wall biosynthesis
LLSSIRARDLAKPRWQRLWDRRTVHWARKIVFNSRSVVEYAKKEEGIRDEQVVVIPNGVADLRALALQHRATSRRDLGLEPETIVLGSVGRLQPQKNQTLLLRACAKLPATNSIWKLLIVGDGPDKAKLQATASEVGLRDRVLWLGARADVERLLAAMDLFVHTADFEGMPNALMEAMAMGLPAVASRVDGAIELIRDGISGYLVPAGDAPAFADRISRIMSDSKLAARLGENAHREILEAFGMDRMIDAYHQLFTSVVSPGST